MKIWWDQLSIQLLGNSWSKTQLWLGSNVPKPCKSRLASTRTEAWTTSCIKCNEDENRLISSIQTLIGRSENLKICIVEDDHNLRFTIKQILEKQGNIVIESPNGKDALSKLKKEKNLPDIILLDLMMPVMNGFEFLNEIKGTKIKSIPILVLTGADLNDNDKRFLKSETEKVLKKTDDTVLSIAEEISKVIKRTS